MPKTVNIVKASGEVEPFSEKKYRESLKRVGTPPKVIDEMVAKIQQEFTEGMTTKEIYQKTFAMLKKKERCSACKYNLKRAIMELGPSGYPFEHFFAKVLNAQGYETEVSQVVAGKCIEHEIDVIANKGGKDHCLIECKFHRRQGLRSTVQTGLYVKARFDDISLLSDRYHGCWVVTNTRFSTDAIKYGECVGLTMLGWSYPAGAGLESMIDKCGLHPITCLTTLSKKYMVPLLKEGVVLARDLPDHTDLLASLSLGKRKITTILNEVKRLCDVQC